MTARWYAAWILFFNVCIVFLMYGLWLTLTLTGTLLFDFYSFFFLCFVFLFTNLFDTSTLDALHAFFSLMFSILCGHLSSYFTHDGT